MRTIIAILFFVSFIFSNINGAFAQETNFLDYIPTPAEDCADEDVLNLYLQGRDNFVQLMPQAIATRATNMAPSDDGGSGTTRDSLHRAQRWRHGR